MSRYIDADELKKVFRDEEDAEYTRWTLAGVLYEIDDIEAADVEKVRHGRWNELPYSYECTVCGIIRPKEMTGKWRYCPNCGAKMKV